MVLFPTIYQLEIYSATIISMRSTKKYLPLRDSPRSFISRPPHLGIWTIYYSWLYPIFAEYSLGTSWQLPNMSTNPADLARIYWPLESFGILHWAMISCNPTISFVSVQQGINLACISLRSSVLKLDLFQSAFLFWFFTQMMRRIHALQ